MNNVKQIIYKVSERAKHLANMNISELRTAADYIGEKEENYYRTRGELIELILTEEFIKD